MSRLGFDEATLLASFSQDDIFDMIQDAPENLLTDDDELLALKQEILEATTDRLIEMWVASCSCLTKSPEPAAHDPECKYRLIREELARRCALNGDL